jgi:L-fucose isomerase-like protein
VKAVATSDRFPIKPRLGVLFFSSGWFREVGLQDPASDTTARVEETARRVVEHLSAFCRPEFSGVLFSVEEARAAARRIAAAGVDGLLVSPLMWCEDQIVRAALAELPELPLVLWTFSPEEAVPEFVPFQRMIQGSGAVCTLQLSGMLKREGRRYRSVAGPLGDPEVYRAIGAHARGMAVARALRGLRVGVLPFPCSQMSTTYVDEFGLRRLYGIELAWLELERFRRAAGEASAVKAQAFRGELEASGQRIRTDERSLQEGIRYALALEQVLGEERLAVLAMNDVIPQMHERFGLRPCLASPRLSEQAVVAMEADIAAGVAMYALRLATGERPFYTETFNVDYQANALLLGHAGYHDAANADPAYPVEVVPDVEYQNTDRFPGAVSFFKYKSGPVTLVNSVWDGERLKWVALQGRSLEGPPKMDGNCHLFCSLEMPVRELFQRSVDSGVSQHWIVVHGQHLEALKILCDTAGIGLLALR